jgi:hypothetical protein
MPGSSAADAWRHGEATATLMLQHTTQPMLPPPVKPQHTPAGAGNVLNRNATRPENATTVQPSRQVRTQPNSTRAGCARATIKNVHPAARFSTMPREQGRNAARARECSVQDALLLPSSSFPPETLPQEAGNMLCVWQGPVKGRKTAMSVCQVSVLFRVERQTGTGRLLERRWCRASRRHARRL